MKVHQQQQLKLYYKEQRLQNQQIQQEKDISLKVGLKVKLLIHMILQH
jgi:hypothetical protein